MTTGKEEHPDAVQFVLDQPWPHYFSTSCMHGLHFRCLGECKFCTEKCRCSCHQEKP